MLEASTGEQALDIARTAEPTLVVLDVNLPDISGIEVCRRIKEHPATSSIMVLQMSYGQSANGRSAIDVSLARTESGEFRLRVSDNGKGADPSAAEHSGLGRRLVDTFVRQLSGRMESRTSDHGYEVVVVFPEQSPQSAVSSLNRGG